MAPSIEQGAKVKSQAAETLATVRKPKTMVSTAEMFKPAYKQKLAAARLKDAIAKNSRVHAAGVQKRVKASKKASSHPLSDAFNDASSGYISTVLEEGLGSLDLAHSKLTSRLNTALSGEEDAAIKQLKFELTRPFDTESLTITENTLDGEKTKVTLGGQMRDFAALIKREEDNLARLTLMHDQVTELLEKHMLLYGADETEDVSKALDEKGAGWEAVTSYDGSLGAIGSWADYRRWSSCHATKQSEAESAFRTKLKDLHTEVEQLGAEELAQMAREEKESEMKKRTARRSLVESARHLL